ncbi:MAG: MFS transporter [Chloroflexota bacterium]
MNAPPVTQRDAGLRGLSGNRPFVLLWGGQTVSAFGDALFTLAIMWAVYAQSHSALQTAIIQAVWHLSNTLFGPVGGTLVDRWDRKRTLVAGNLVAGLVVGCTAVVALQLGHLLPAVVFVAVFALNALVAVIAPARFSILPNLVKSEQLATASGAVTAGSQAALFLGDTVAGVIIARAGAAWAVAIDAVSFLVASVLFGVAKLPARAASAMDSAQGWSFARDIREGWHVIAGQPTMRALLQLGVIINLASFIGPLYPALVRVRLHAGAAAYGALGATSVIGAAAGGLMAGAIEKRIGAGQQLIAGWALAGACALGIALSTWLVATAALEAVLAFGITVGSVAMTTLNQSLISEKHRGRVYGIMVGLGAITIPASALLAGWLADVLGPAPLFAVAGVIILGVAGMAWASAPVRTARL